MVHFDLVNIIKGVSMNKNLEQSAIKSCKFWREKAEFKTKNI